MSQLSRAFYVSQLGQDSVVVNLGRKEPKPTGTANNSFVVVVVGTPGIRTNYRATKNNPQELNST